ncbi:MAG: PAS domain-containing protein, partial [Gammaproteobacteria bacterium]|nr:PAS domain-containing protein [Gammaproteobacteria bacterium]
GTILSVNPSCISLFDANEKQLINSKLSDFLTDGEDKIKRYLLLCKSSGEYLPGGFTLKKSQGQSEHITLEGCLLKPRTHRGPAFLIMRAFPKARSIKSFSILNEKVAQLTREIHDKNRIEKGLRESEEKVRLLLQSTAESIYGVNNQGICTFANKALLEMLEIDTELDIVGKQAHPLMHHSDISGNKVPESRSPVYQAYRGQIATHVSDGIIWKQDGTSVPVEYWAHPIIRDNNSIGAVVTIINITERRQIRNALHTLAVGTSGIMGEKFFEDCARSLADIHHASLVIIGEFHDDTPQDLLPICAIKNGEIVHKETFHINEAQLGLMANGTPLY